MGGNRRWWRIGIGVAAMVVATGCGDKGDGREEAGVSRQPKKVPASSAPPLVTATTVSPPVTDTTVTPRKAPAPTVAPVRPTVTTTTTTTTVVAPPVQDIVQPPEPESPYEVDNPWVVVSPSRAPAGTRVFLDGTGFTADHWQSHGQLWLSIVGGQSSCYLMALADSQVVIDDTGHLEGSFVVPEKGPCRFSVDEMSTAGFQFNIAYQCTACHIGTFFVPPHEADPDPGLGGTYCGTWGYSHGTVQSAEVYAEGVPCDSLQPIRDVAWAWAPVNGPQHVVVAGFSCDRIGESLGGAPTATYRCVKGSQSVSLITTGRS